jgi:hypothetical protein
VLFEVEQQQLATKPLVSVQLPETGQPHDGLVVPWAKDSNAPRPKKPEQAILLVESPIGAYARSLPNSLGTVRCIPSHGYANLTLGLP